MAHTNPPGRFDYLFDELIEPDEDVGYDGSRLDAYAPEPRVWYQTTPAVLAMIAITLAAIAIVICAVLLVTRQSRGHGNTAVRPATAPTTTATASTSSAPPPPAPSPASTPSPTDTASAVILPTNPTRAPAKPPPATGGNRLPITRSPLRFAPAPQPAFPHY